MGTKGKCLHKMYLLHGVVRTNHFQFSIWCLLTHTHAWLTDSQRMNIDMDMLIWCMLTMAR